MCACTCAESEKEMEKAGHNEENSLVMSCVCVCVFCRGVETCAATRDQLLQLSNPARGLTRCCLEYVSVRALIRVPVCFVHTFIRFTQQLNFLASSSCFQKTQINKTGYTFETTSYRKTRFQSLHPHLGKKKTSVCVTCLHDFWF